MLEFLDAAPMGDAAVASHHAIQVIRQWATATPVEDYFATTGTELTPSQVDLVKQIILDVERQGHRSVRELSPDQRTAYVEVISNHLLDLSNRQLQLDATEGKALLSRLRSTARV